MAPEYQVREATMKDAAVLHTLVVQLADALSDRMPDEAAVRERLREMLDAPNARVLVVEDGGAPVGAATLWIKPDLAHGDCVVEVPMLVVSEEARRGGIGKLLVEEIMALAASEGASLIELIATRDNSEARLFYRSLGFVETEHVALEFVGELEDPPEARAEP